MKDYGFLTAISGRLPAASDSALVKCLEEQSRQSGLSQGELLLSWAYYRLGGIVVTSSSKAERAAKVFELLSSSEAPVANRVFESIERAAEKDGPEGKIFYGHPHMEKARQGAIKA